MREFSDQDIRQNRRKAAIRRRRRNQLVLIVITFVLIFVAVIGFLIVKNKSHDTQLLRQFHGTWKYDEYTQYEFDGNGNGCMCLENLHYEYTYTVKDNELKLDFKDDSVRDCTYTFSIKNDTLTITGGEGTVGGSYELYKQN